MNIEDLQSIMIDSYQVGYMEAIKSYEPSQDSIRLREVKKWLKMMKIDLKRFNILVQKILSNHFVKVKGKNSPLYFSKTEIKQALSVANVSRILARDKVKSVINDNVALRCSLHWLILLRS